MTACPWSIACSTAPKMAAVAKRYLAAAASSAHLAAASAMSSAEKTCTWAKLQASQWHTIALHWAAQLRLLFLSHPATLLFLYHPATRQVHDTIGHVVTALLELWQQGSTLDSVQLVAISLLALDSLSSLLVAQVLPAVWHFFEATSSMIVSLVILWMIRSDLAAVARVLKSMAPSLQPTLADESQVTALSANHTLLLFFSKLAVLVSRHMCMPSHWFPLGWFALACPCGCVRSSLQQELGQCLCVCLFRLSMME